MDDFKKLTEQFLKIYINAESVNDFGIENYKKLLDKYNTRLEQLRENKTLPTPQQIVDTVRRDKSKEVEDYDKDIMEL